MGLKTLTLIIVSFLGLVSARSRSRGKVPCMFIFGDSLVDNGNNNDILTLARANYLPYGVDFPGGVTGRFCNGRTTVDFLAAFLGFSEYIPPYATTSGTALLRGVNFASGAAGIRDETGRNLGEHLSMNQQVANFARSVEEMRALLSRSNISVTAYLRKCIFSVGMGSNDYLNNYFMPDYYNTGSQYTPREYASSLIQDYGRQLMELYELGARKVAVIGVGQIGCIPYELARSTNDDANGARCVSRINNAIILFNSGLLSLVKSFNSRLPGAKFTYINSYSSFQHLIANASSYGFTVVDKGCCGVGRNNGQVTCLPFQQPCSNRTEYIFWDAFHPTEAANIILAQKAYASKYCSDAYPINIRQLAKQ
ncbi:hypothetical protein AMTRI_Chr11g158050 [Amborella trichopoda]